MGMETNGNYGFGRSLVKVDAECDGLVGKLRMIGIKKWFLLEDHL